MHQENVLARSEGPENWAGERAGQAKDLDAACSRTMTAAPTVAPAKPEPSLLLAHSDHPLLSSALPGMGGTSACGTVFRSHDRPSSPDVPLALKRNGTPQWGSGLSRKKAASDVSGKPCSSSGNLTQIVGGSDPEILVEHIQVLQASEKEMECQLDVQSAHHYAWLRCTRLLFEVLNLWKCVESSMLNHSTSCSMLCALADTMCDMSRVTST
jgi:hypothetical protein